MHDQVGMRVGNRAEDINKQTNPCFHTERVLIAVLIDSIPFDVFENDVRLPCACHTGINQFRDVRMCQAGQDVTLAPKSFLAVLAD